jgi:tripartite ATP-independent transporter DctP family solute receptor
MKKMLFFVLIAVLAINFAFAGGSQEVASSAKPVILKGGLVSPADTTQTKTLLDWAEKVKERTNGAVIIEVYPAEQLGNERTLLENTNLGTIDWTLIGPSGAERFTPIFGMFENAYTFQSLDHIKNSVFNAEFVGYLSNILESNSNLKLLGFQWFGSRHVIADKPILTPEAGRGLLMRTPEVPAYKVAAYAMGTTATPMAYGEVYMGLSQGVINAAECPLENINVMKWYEVKKHITLTSHVEGMTTVFMNKQSFEKKLTPELQKIVYDAAIEAWNEEFDSYQASQDILMDELRAKGITFHEPSAEQKAVFVSRAQEMLAKDYIPKWGEAWEKFQSYVK